MEKSTYYNIIFVKRLRDVSEFLLMNFRYIPFYEIYNYAITGGKNER